MGIEKEKDDLEKDIHKEEFCPEKEKHVHFNDTKESIKSTGGLGNVIKRKISHFVSPLKGSIQRKTMLEEIQKHIFFHEYGADEFDDESGDFLLHIPAQEKFIQKQALCRMSMRKLHHDEEELNHDHLTEYDENVHKHDDECSDLDEHVCPTVLSKKTLQIANWSASQ